MADLSLSAIITAVYDEFTDAMNNIAQSAHIAMEEVRNAFSDGSSEAENSLNKLEDKNKEAADSIKEQFAEVREQIMHLAEAYGVLEGLKWGEEQVAQALEAGEALERAAVITGIGVQQLQQLKFAAEATGGSFEQLTTFAQQVQRQIASLSSGQSNVRLTSVLQQAGIDPASIRDSQSAIEQLQGAISKFGEQSEVVRDLFVTLGGRSGLQLLPTLTALDEMSEKMKQMGVGMSPEMVEQLEHANEQVHILGAGFDDLRNKIVAGLATPTLSLAGDLLQNLIGYINQAANDGQMQQWGIQIEHAIADAAVEALDFFQDIEQVVQAAKELWDALEKVVGVLNTINEFAGKIGDAIHAGVSAVAHDLETNVLSAYAAAHGDKLLPGGAPSTLGASDTSIVSGDTADKAGVAGAETGKSFAERMKDAIRKGVEENDAELAKLGRGAKGVPDTLGPSNTTITGPPADATSKASKAQDPRTKELSEFATMEHAKAEIAGGTAAQIAAADEAVYQKAIQLYQGQGIEVVKAQATAVEAQRRAADDGYHAFEQGERQKAALAGDGAAQQLKAAQDVYSYAVQHYGDQSKQAEAAYVRVAEAAKRASQESQRAAEEDFRNFQRLQTQKAELANNTPQAKLTQATNVAQYAQANFGAGSSQYQDAFVKQITAQRAYNAQVEQLQVEQTQNAEKSYEDQISSQNEALKSGVQLQTISKQQEIAGEMSADQQISTAQQQMYTQLETLAGNDEKKKEQFQQQAVQAAQRAAQQEAQLATQAAAQYLQAWESVGSRISGVGDQLVDGLVKGNLNIKQVMQQSFIQILNSFIDMVTQMTVRWLAFETITAAAGAGMVAPGAAGAPGMATSGIGAFLGPLGGMLGVGAAGGAGGAATAAATTANTTATVASTTATTADTTAMTANTVGIAGLVAALTANTAAVTAAAVASGAGGIGQVASGLGPLGMLGLAAFAEGGIVPSAASGMVAPSAADGMILSAIGGMVVPSAAGGMVISAAGGTVVQEMSLPASIRSGIERTFPSAAGGMIASGNGPSTPAILHSGELVVPSDLSARMIQGFAGGGMIPSAAGGMMVPSTVGGMMPSAAGGMMVPSAADGMILSAIGGMVVPSAAGGMVISAAGGMVVQEMSLPASIRSGIERTFPSAAGGMIASGNGPSTPAILHSGELVVPSDLSARMIQGFAGGGMVPSAVGGMVVPSAAGGMIASVASGGFIPSAAGGMVLSVAGGSLIPSAAGGMMVQEMSLPSSIRAGIERAFPSAAEGMISHGHGPATPALLHQGEMVVPADLTARMLHSFAAGGMVPSAAGGMFMSGAPAAKSIPMPQSARPLPTYTPGSAPSNASSPQGFESNQGGGHTFNVTVNHSVSAMDADSFRDKLGDHSNFIAATVMDAIQRNGVGRFGRAG